MLISRRWRKSYGNLYSTIIVIASLVVSDGQYIIDCIKLVTDKQVFYDKFCIDMFYLLVFKGKLDKISITDEQMKLVNAKLAGL